MIHRSAGRRRPARPTESPVESTLRSSLAAHAREAPEADRVADAILSATRQGPEIPGNGSAAKGVSWRRVGLPLVAAAAVVAVVGVGVAAASLHTNNPHDRAATRGPSATSTAPSPTSTATPSAGPSATRSVIGTSGLRNVKILDLTFVSLNRGFALASAQCLGKPSRCTALLQTTNGTTWTKMGGGIDFDVPGVGGGCPPRSCVQHIRFANTDDGFAYGPDAFFVTTDGGSTWTKQPGGAEALETLDGNTIRVSANNSSECAQGCQYALQTAEVGSTTWSKTPLPGRWGPSGVGVQLSRSGSDAYLLVTQQTTGGASNAGSLFYRSSDDGHSWTMRNEPCPRRERNGISREVDSYQVAAGANGSVSVLCQERGSREPFRVAVSTDEGRKFRDASGTIADTEVASPLSTDGSGSLPSVLVGSRSTVLAVAGDGVWISRDGGRYFAQAPGLIGRFSQVGFESTRVGRAVTADGGEIWTTRNAGRTWIPSTP